MIAECLRANAEPRRHDTALAPRGNDYMLTGSLRRFVTRDPAIAASDRTRNLRVCQHKVGSRR